MGKLQFKFMAKPSSDKNLISSYTLIITQEEKTFSFPIELQPAILNKEVKRTDVFRKVKNAIKKIPKKKSLY